MNFFDLSTSIDLSVLDILIRLFTGLLLSLLIVYHYNKNSNSLSDRNFFSRTFPLILLTTLLVISVVKSSLALSLGLVGALSIVRFRTPIKEPEDLVYLFICSSWCGLELSRLSNICGYNFYISCLHNFFAIY